MVIPPAAVEQLARALYARDGYAPWETEELDVILDYRAEARSLLEAEARRHTVPTAALTLDGVAATIAREIATKEPK
jgi:hypothetical protein